ncbi:two-component system NtrC family sensor kinase [Siphonobacter sp. BAB-5404]|nr:two-component system NtrC family sensor kinase [Siphonobacter sp. SORGH_AS_0500]
MLSLEKPFQNRILVRSFLKSSSLFSEFFMSTTSFLIAFFFINYVRKTIQSESKYPELDRLIVSARYLTVGLWGMQFLFHEIFILRLVGPVYLLLLVWLTHKKEELQPVQSTSLSILPYAFISIFGELVKFVSKDFYNQFDGFFEAGKFFAFVWVFILWLNNRKQEKALEAERLKLEKQEELGRVTEAQRDQLEVLVAERTAELRLQKEELEKALSHLKSTQNQLIHAEKMASLGELTAGIAHEIQNPLNFVNNFSEVSIELVDELREESQKPEQDTELIIELLTDIEQNLQKIQHHGKRADSIVKGMLQHSRTSSGQKEDIDLNAMAEEYLRLAYHGLRAKDKTFNAKMVTELDPMLGKVHVLPQDLGRVLLNMLTNAFYAVSDKKRQQPQGYEPTVWIVTQSRPNQVIIRVRDNGTGMPDSVKQKIFQPFFTTKPTGQGTGLGLSLSYDIITKGHGGSLEVITQEGAFTEFIIRLPR